MASDSSSISLDRTLRDFVAGQKVFGRYTLTRILGRGGMGIVWLAHDDELDLNVALKFLPEIIVQDRGVVEDLKRETKRCLELTHKNIIRIHDFIQDNVSACISMEHIDGDTLSNLRADKATRIFEPSEIEPWLTQLCEALDYAHNHARIIHRDLKPSNLMISKRGVLKIADFGIARSLTDSVSMLTHSTGTSGTLVYMSPQQLDGMRATHLDDIYSVGATLYELITSKPPFYSGDINRQIHEKIPPPMIQRRVDLDIEGNPIPKNWEETIAACLAKYPAQRPQSVTQVAAHLGLMRGDEPANGPLVIVKPPISVGKTLAKKPDDSRHGLISALVLTLALGVIVGWWFGVEQPKRHAESERREQKRIATVEAVRKAEEERKTIETKRQAAAEVPRKAEEERNAAAAAEAKRNADAETARKAEEDRKAAEVAEAKRKTDELESVRKLEEQRKLEEAEAKKRAAEEEIERKKEEKRKAEEARLAALPKTINVPADEQTISAAMLRARKGDTVKIKAGTYEEQIFYREGVILAGVDCKTVTVRTEATKAVLVIDNCASGKISGITFEHEDNASDPHNSWVVYIANSHIEISGCNIRKAGGFGMVIEHGATPSVHDCVIEGSVYSGIVVSDKGTRPVLKANTVRENGESGIHFDRGCGGSAEKNICTGNNNGISIANDGTNPNLKFNNASGNKYDGITFSDAANGIAEDNKCESNSRQGISVEGTGTKARLISNQCGRNSNSGISFCCGSSGIAEKNQCDGNADGIWVSGAGTSAALSNNHCFNNHETSSGMDGLGVAFDQNATGSASGNTCNNNSVGTWVANGASPVLQGNVLTANFKNGMEFSSGCAGTAIGNTSQGNGGCGMCVLGAGTRPTISGNTLFNNGGNGIYVGIGPAPAIGQNNIGQNGFAPIFYESSRTQQQPVEGDY